MMVGVVDRFGSNTSEIPRGEPYAGRLHIRFDEGAGVPDEGCSALLYKIGRASCRERVLGCV